MPRMSYRDDEAALRAYRDDLARELAGVDDRLAPLAELTTTRQRLAERLAGIDADLAQRTAQRATLRLANLRIASPCRVSWQSMTGDDHVRHCGQCDKKVFQLSSLTAAAAEALLAEH